MLPSSIILFHCFEYASRFMLIAAAILAIIVVFIRERKGISRLTILIFFLLFLLVNVTGFLEGGMTFGPYQMLPPLSNQLTEVDMKNYILGMLCLIGSLTASLQAHQMNDGMSGGMMGSNMMQNMAEVSENDLLSTLSDQERSTYQQLNPQQKALVLKAANQFSCHAHMQMMRQRMMQQNMNQQGMMNK